MLLTDDERDRWLLRIAEHMDTIPRTQWEDVYLKTIRGRLELGWRLTEAQHYFLKHSVGIKSPPSTQKTV